MKIFVNKNIYLRNCEKTDFSSIYNYSKKKEFVKFMEYKPFTKKTCKEWIKKKLNKKNVDFYSIIFNSNVVGTYPITFEGIKKHMCDLSYGLDPSFQKKGIFSKVTKKIISKYKLKRFQIITSISHKNNIKSVKKLKFKSEGILRNYYFDLKTKKFFDGIIFSKCR